MAITKEKIYEAISTVMDPEVGFNLVAMGLIYDAKAEGNIANVTMTLSSAGCPLHEMMKTWVKEAVEKIEGIDSCHVEVVWEPAWNITMANDEVQKALGGKM